MLPSRKNISSLLSEPCPDSWPVLQIDILGGFLDSTFCDYIQYIGKLSQFNFKFNTILWASLLSRVNSKPPDCDVLIVPLSLYELAGINHESIASLICHFSSYIDTLISSDRYSSIFFLLSTISPDPSSSQIYTSSAVRDFRNFIFSLFQLHDGHKTFCIDLNSIDVSIESHYRDWVLYGFPYPLLAQFRLAQIVTSTLVYKSGLGKKVIVLDLDETLWPYLLGDLVSPTQCSLDAAIPIHRFYIDFQRYLLTFRSRGFLLSIASKNDPSRVSSLFSGSGHPLSSDHFVSPILSWDSKCTSLQIIASNLNLSLDSFIFIDNSSSEVAEVQERFPQILSLCLGDDPSRFISICENSFHLSSLYIDKLSESRHISYKLSSAPTSVKYDTQVSIILNSTEYFDRTLQLLNKTNQFNLTGSKTSLDLLNSCDHVFVFGLKDQFQDYGITSVILAECIDSQLVINQWVLSCRTFSRGFEISILDILVKWCLDQNISTITSIYIPSPKNIYMQKLFSSEDFNCSLSNLPIPVSFALSS